MKRWSAIALVPALALIAMAGCSHGPADTFGEREAVPILAAKVVQKTVADTIRAIGRVEAFSTVDVKAQINGQVMQVHFRQGQDVKQGDLLFTIDPRPFEAALQQAQANLAKDRAQYREAATDEQRYSVLLKQNVGSRQQYDQAEATAAALSASMQADEAAVQTARLNLEYCKIRAPIDGRTGDLLVHAGNLVKPDADTAMVVINQVHPVYVDFAIPEQKLPAVREFMAQRKLAVQVSLPEQQGVESGELTFVDNSVDSKTGTINLKGQFDNANGRLWPGEYVNATLILHDHPGAILVPSQAVQTGQQGSFVFVVQPEMKVELRPIVIGETIDNETVVNSGLKAGETVVTDGQLRLIPGATVTIKSGLTGNGAAS
ncbi:efflux RND transporter periplasmic adaptor subunit [Candidatus Binatus sp.]|uniref:efflux RND transporter periplasmic adaptor subunit n=1 Tax=Candidatus Binatus sp. TaxID=2811406 RepID=UPI002B45F0E3|nr:efflux RND transporter periplasmic adaptor subunit [Candidatus Binatus sp.]